MNIYSELKMTINGKEYVAPKPKVGALRMITKFNRDFKQKNLLQDDDAVDGVIELIVYIFSNEEITKAYVEENMLLEDMFDTFQNIDKWITNVFAKGKAAKGDGNVGPNVEAQ